MENRRLNTGRGKKYQVAVAVTNDITTDRRVEKLCRSLQSAQCEPRLIGRRLKESFPLKRSYQCVRFRLLFNKGALFYAEYNIRLFFYLLFARVNAIHSNDLDTLPACYCAAKLRKKQLLYDSHEYFTEVPELLSNPFARKVWLMFEGLIFPKLKHIFTVNESIANAYEKRYGVKPKVVRNVPEKQNRRWNAACEELELDSKRFRVIMQGSGINIHRGAEELLEAFKYLDQKFELLIIGSGDVWSWLIKKHKEWKLEGKVKLIQRIPYDHLMKYTASTHLGVSIDKPNNPNYQFSLPNKLFDYFNAGIPVLCSNLDEIVKIVNHHNAGWIILNHNPKEIAEKIREISEDVKGYEMKKNNAKIASTQYEWQKEVKPILDTYEEIRKH